MSTNSFSTSVKPPCSAVCIPPAGTKQGTSPNAFSPHFPFCTRTQLGKEEMEGRKDFCLGPPHSEPKAMGKRWQQMVDLIKATFPLGQGKTEGEQGDCFWINKHCPPHSPET